MYPENNEQLKIYLEEATSLALEVVASTQEMREKTSLHMMCWCYLKKQINHALSIKKLADNYDTLIIARSMIEAMIMLFWASKDKKRVLLWNEYRYVYNFKQLLREDSMNFYNLPKGGQKVIEDVKEYVRKYYPQKKINNTLKKIQTSTLKNKRV